MKLPVDNVEDMNILLIEMNNAARIYTNCICQRDTLEFQDY